MPRYILDLSIGAETMLRYYRGQAVSVTATDRRGKRVRFPAAALRPHMTDAGVHGTFCLETDDEH